MEVEFDVGDDAPLNDCTGVLSLEKNVRVYSSVFTCKSLRDVDPEDQAMLTLIIAFCATNFAQQHQDTRAYLSTHKTVHADKVFAVYVVCVVVPQYTRFKYSQLVELKSTRMTRIVDIEVGPKIHNPRQQQHPQQQQGQIQVTAHSMLNPFKLVDLTFSHVHFNMVHSVSNDLPKERGIIKRPRRSYEDDK